jgi:predicted NACHT family NTPase
MFGFLQNLSFDQISFWVGFIAGALGLWLISKLIPALPGLREDIRNRSKKTRSRLTSSNAERLRQETLFHVQGLHLASPLFSLDEIMVEPQILASPTVVDPGSEDLATDILSLTIPYLPDWPELASRYSAKTISLGNALRGGANLILMGHPGSGKTVTLAYLICQIVRRDDKIPELAGMLPIYIHVANLIQDDQSSKSPLDLIRTAVHSYVDSWSANRLESVLAQALQTGRALVLVDGLDEVSPSIHQEVVSFLNELTQSYPKARLVVSSTPDNFSGLTEMGLM